MTLAETLKVTTRRLEKAGVPQARMETEFLIAELLGHSRAELLRRGAETVSIALERRLEDGIRQREMRKPLAYITGSQPFLDFMLHVTPAVLIPRPETEQLAEKILKSLDESQEMWDVVDVGTGSGNLSISLARHFMVRHVYGVDVSKKALIVARQNAKRLGQAEKCSWVLSDLLSAIPAGRKTLLVANLPYIKTADLKRLEAELGWEPRSALEGGETGLQVIEALISQAEVKVAATSRLWLEIGHDQAPAVTRRLRESGEWTDISVENDWAGWPRFVRATRSVS